MKAIKGVNDLKTKYPELINEWDYQKNGAIRPDSIGCCSNKNVWWTCDNGHSFRQRIVCRTKRGYGCPYCSGRIAVPGVNDLATTHPQIAAEWSRQNQDLRPSDFSYGSNKKVWWTCSNGHNYEQTINKRVLRGSSCPYCSGHKVLVGYNDLATKYPRLVLEWHPIRNGDLTPSDVTYGTARKVWWKCPVGHEYQATIHDRTAKGGTNCPICSLRLSTSFPEQAIFFYCRKLYPNTQSKNKDILDGRLELDIYIPDIRLGIEFDGANWHKTKTEHDRERRKYKQCQEADIKLFRVKESNGTSWTDVADSICYISSDYKHSTNELEEAIRGLLNAIDRETNHWTRTKQKFNSDINVDIDRDRPEILNYLQKIENSLTDTRPDIVKLWDYSKNGKLTPSMFSVGSNQVVNWKCHTCNAEWRSSINSMTHKRKLGCPVCSMRDRGRNFTRMTIALNGSLAERNPILSEEWNIEKNAALTPSDVTEKCNKKVWWLCGKCGYEWQSSPNNRSKGVGCPCCSGRVPMIGINDLATKYPDVAAEWNYNKNEGIKPSEFLPHSGKKVWWKCVNCGHEWESTITSRTRGHGCPKCSSYKRMKILGMKKN